MKIAIMQPYFFPYIGYFQLIKAVDEFILLDEVQYINKGWINRNRVLSPNLNKGFMYITVPIKKHKQKEIIKNIFIDYTQNWIDKILGQLTYYKKIKSPYYKNVIDLVSIIKKKYNSIVELNYNTIKTICDYLGITTKISISSSYDFDYKNIIEPGDWAFEISLQKRANLYINPIGGRGLFNKEKFLNVGIEIKFLKSENIIYQQSRREFIASLSILDVLMFNSKKNINLMLEKYELL